MTVMDGRTHRSPSANGVVSSKASTIHGAGIWHLGICRPSTISVGRPPGNAGMAADFVISDIRCASAADLRCPIRATTECTCDSRTPSGARWSERWPPSIPLPIADRPLPKPSVISWWLTPAPCSGWRSRERHCVTQRMAFQTGSAGAWLEPFVLQHRADVNVANRSKRRGREQSAGNLQRATRIRWAVEAAGPAGTVDSLRRVPRGTEPTVPWETGKRPPVSHRSLDAALEAQSWAPRPQASTTRVSGGRQTKRRGDQLMREGSAIPHVGKP